MVLILAAEKSRLEKASEEVYRPRIFPGPPASSRMTNERKMENTQCPA
jgi:hypothetical protein